MSASSLFIIVVCFVYTASALFQVKKINLNNKPFKIQISGDPLKNPVTFTRLSHLNDRFPIKIGELENPQQEFQVVTPEEDVPEEDAKCINHKINGEIQKEMLTMKGLQKKLNAALEAQRSFGGHNIIHFLPLKQEPVTIEGYKFGQPNVPEPEGYVTQQHSLVNKAVIKNIGLFPTPGQHPQAIAVRMVKDRPFAIEFFGGPLTTPVFFSAVPQSTIQFYIGEGNNRQNFKVIQPANPDSNSQCIREMRTGHVMTTTDFQALLNRAVSEQPRDTRWQWNPIHFNSRVAVTIITGPQVVRYNQRHPMEPIPNDPNAPDPIVAMPGYYISTDEGAEGITTKGIQTKGIQTKEGEVEGAIETAEAEAAGGHQEVIKAHEDYYNVDEGRYSDGVVHQKYYDMDRLQYS
eukprot:36065_1